MAVALIVAAGRGERLGAAGPKALVKLAGRSLLEWSVHALRAVDDVDEIVVALPPGVRAPEGTLGVLGGEARSHSVGAALRAAGPGDEVIVHDAARPLARPALFVAALAELRRSGADAVVAAAPVTDTIKQARRDDAGAVHATLERSRLWAVQTPQVFQRPALQHALKAGYDALAAATDDAGLVERAGGVVRLVASSRDNVKVTTPLDLRVAELLVRERGH